MTFSGTYDPADNKLRLRASARLDKELYTRVRGAGFIWAPRQELFVAPMWTPGRADLLTELCGEIGDEDTSLVERSEQRAERFEEYSENRTEDAERAHKAVSSIADNIPLGQPILIGHHSEKHARRDAEKIENGMRRAVKMWETAQYWKERAAGAIANAKYKELPAVRARRIKGLEKDQRSEQAVKDKSEKCVKFWNGELKLSNKATGETATEVTRETALWFCNHVDHISKCFTLAEYPRTAPASQYEGSMDLWSALGGSDGPEYAIITVEQAREIALRCHARVILNRDRWLSHIANRLEYERAMLAASGGTEADKTKPEVGGACKCWTSPSHGWSYIKKVNRVSVTVLHAYGGTRVFKQIMAFDKLRAMMSKADVDAARAAGKIVEVENGTGFLLSQTRAEFDAENPPEPTPTPEPVEQGEKFDAMRETLRAGVKVVTAPQLFPTPADLARRMADTAGILAGRRVLEPSAGTGNILRAIIDNATGANCVHIVAVEQSRELVTILEQQRQKTVYANEGNFQIVCADFLTCNGDLGKFDRVLMNPPFADAQDIAHIKHALTMLKPGGRLVAICANGPRQQFALKHLAENSGGSYEPLPADTFKESGTGVNTALVVIEG